MLHCESLNLLAETTSHFRGATVVSHVAPRRTWCVTKGLGTKLRFEQLAHITPTTSYGQPLRSCFHSSLPLCVCSSWSCCCWLIRGTTGHQFADVFQGFPRGARHDGFEFARTARRFLLPTRVRFEGSAGRRSGDAALRVFKMT